MKSKIYSIFTVVLTATILSLGFNARAQQIITTIAGGKIGDNNPAIQALLVEATGVAADAQGNVYICDYGHNIVRKVNTSGIISTVAGTGVAGFTGDNIPAISSELFAPIAIKVDRHGNLFIADNGNNRVRKVTTDGIIHTVAGNGVIGFLGDGANATLAEFDNITDIAVDTFGSVYIADRNNNRVRKVNPSGIVHTIAGDGGVYYHGNDSLATLASVAPQSIALDDTGNVYIGDANGYIQRINPMDTLHTLYVSPLMTGLLWHAGILYTSDFFNSVVYAINLSDGTFPIFAGTAGMALYTGDGGLATAADIGNPWSIAIDPTGNIYFSDIIDNVIRMVNPAGIISTFAGATPVCCNGIPATDAGLVRPFGVAADVFGNVIIADRDNNVIRRIDHATGLMTTIAGTGVAGYNGDAIQATTAQLDSPTDVKIDALGNIYIADEKNSAIRVIDLTGTINTIAGTPQVAGYAGDGAAATGAALDMPHSIAIDLNNNLYIADMYNHVVRVVDVTGTINTFAGINLAGFTGDGGAATAAALHFPSAVVVDATGNVYIADKANSRIRKVTTDGNINTVVGSGIAGQGGDHGPVLLSKLDSPTSLAIDPYNRLYICDESNQRVRIVIDTTIYTMAGNGTIGFSGDGGPAVQAELNFPEGIHVDQYGNLYIADSKNERIRYTTYFQAAEQIENLQANNISLYPNPNQGNFTVKGDVSGKNAEIAVLNAVGQSVYTENVPVVNGSFTHNIDLSSKYASGVYFIRVKTGNETKTIRFTMER